MNGKIAEYQKRNVESRIERYLEEVDQYWSPFVISKKIDNNLGGVVVKYRIRGKKKEAFFPFEE